jgi:PAS domain S-box-containing protein
MSEKDEGMGKGRFSELPGKLQSNGKIVKFSGERRPTEHISPVSEDVYRIIFENTGTATVILEEDNTIQLVNGEFEKLTGYKREEIEGRKKWMEFVCHKEDLERMKEYHRLRRIDPQSAPRTYEFQLVDRKNQVKDVILTVTPMPLIRQTLAALLDVSYLRRMEAALTETERRLADIIDFLPDATFAIDLSGKVIAWNRTMEEMTGIKTEYMLGKSNYEYSLPFYGTSRPMLIDLVLGSAAEIEKKYNFIKREGSVLLAEVNNVPVKGEYRALWGKAGLLYDSHGNVAGAIESIRDITDRTRAEESLQKAHDELEIGVRERTAELMHVNKVLQREISERKRAEAVLKESEEKYNQFFKTSRDCVFITSKDGRLVDLNDAAVELFGYSSRDELLQKKMPYVYANKEERAKHARVIAECGYVKEYPIYWRKGDGSIRHVLITAVARYDASGGTIGFQGTIRDVTEQRRVEKELRKYREDLESMVAERTSELEDKTRNLQEVNTTLNVLLQKREEDRKILEENLVANISSLVLPYIGGIRRNNLDAQQQLCLDTIEKNLSGIVSPLLKNIRQFELTPREIQIVSLIKDGKTTKEIASALGIGEGSIDTHRKNIRKKMGLSRSCNLQSHLRFLEK